MAAQIRVIAFDMGWNEAQRQGNVGLKFSNGQEVKYRVNSLADLAGWAALLKEEPLFASPNGWIHTGPELVGD